MLDKPLETLRFTLDVLCKAEGHAVHCCWQHCVCLDRKITCVSGKARIVKGS